MMRSLALLVLLSSLAVAHGGLTTQELAAGQPSFLFILVRSARAAVIWGGGWCCQLYVRGIFARHCDMRVQLSVVHGRGRGSASCRAASCSSAELLLSNACARVTTLGGRISGTTTAPATRPTSMRGRNVTALSSCKTSTPAGQSAAPRELRSSRTSVLPTRSHTFHALNSVIPSLILIRTLICSLGRIPVAVITFATVCPTSTAAPT